MFQDSLSVKHYTDFLKTAPRKYDGANDGQSKENLNFDDQSRQVVSLIPLHL